MVATESLISMVAYRLSKLRRAAAVSWGGVTVGRRRGRAVAKYADPVGSPLLSAWIHGRPNTQRLGSWAVNAMLAIRDLAILPSGGSIPNMVSYSLRRSL